MDIRKMNEYEIDDVMNIWLNSNIEAHWFIDKKYWIKNFEFVSSAIAEADVYVVYIDNVMAGFMGITKGGYIAGIFVKNNFRSRGIGKSLLDMAKSMFSCLSLDVYKTNTKAIRFYKREGFKIFLENIDESSGEAEYLMKWNE